MPVWPDIVVTKADSPEVLLAVQVKVGAAGARDAEAQIKAYMVQQSCPIGMLVTPEDTVFFRNRYTGYEPDTIQKIGECRTSELQAGMPERVSVTVAYLERRVEEWLEDLRGSRQTFPASAQDAIESFVRPAVVSGVVRAAGPRWRRTGS